jgi:hypothetical protein
MNVTLKIENDAELRAYIKDCIKGQVLSIVREEFLGIVKEELNRKTKNFETMNFKTMTEQAVKDVVRDHLYSIGIRDWSAEWLNPQISTILEQQITKAIHNKNWNALVDTLAKEKVKALIK